MILKFSGREVWGVTLAGDDTETLFVFVNRAKAEAFIAEWPGRRAKLFRFRMDLEEVRQ